MFALHPYKEVFGCHGNMDKFIPIPLHRIIVQSMLVMPVKCKPFSFNSVLKKFGGQAATLNKCHIQ